MASIQTAIQLTDRVTAPLMNMTSALTTVISEFERVEGASGNAFDVAAMGEARAKLNMVEQELEQISTAAARAESSQSGLNDKLSNGSGAIDGLIKKGAQLVATYASIQSAKEIINLSDKMTQTESRLSLVIDDGGSVDALEEKIRASANRSRADYLVTASAVASFSQRAGDAFNGNDEVIRFTETLNKMYVIAGATAQEQSSSMLQLTQALGSGVLRGEEFNAVFEAAPNIMQSIADYMDVPIGKLRGMAADGEITADIVKNAIMGATEQIDQDFNNMQMTWGQVWTTFKNSAIEKLDPVLQRISNMANSQKFQSFVSSAGNAVGMIANIVVGVFELIGNMGTFISDNWSLLSPLIYAVVAALGVYYGAQLLANGVGLLSKGIHFGMATAAMMHAAVNGTLTATTAAQTAAQYGLNSAMYACPLVWILMLIIAVIAAIYLIIVAINKLTGSTLSATGVIFGAVATVGAAIINIAIGVINGIIQYIWTYFVEPFIGIVEWILNVANGGFDSFGGAVANLIGQIISWFLSLGKVATTIIDAIFGTDWTSGLTSLQDSVISWGKNENAITLSREAPTIDARVNYEDAWNAGYGLGETVENKISGMFSLSGLEKLNTQSDAYNTNSAYEIAKNTADTALNTSDIADKLDITSDQLKYIRNYAEKEAINRFTTASINVEMTNNNNVSSDADLDGIMDTLKDGIQQQMNIVAEGV